MEFKTLQSDMVKAMKAHDKERKDVISALVSAVKVLAIDEQSRDNITSDITDRAILKELKAAKESLDTCPDERAELKAQYKKRYDIINEYAPRLMSAEELEAEMKDKFADVLASKNMGQIMKSVMPYYKGKADGKTINAVVKKLIG